LYEPPSQRWAPGSVPDAADIVVTDPVQAGVMAVMAVADTAKFNVARLKRRVF
jgi:energy-converting hydrogenase B subunit Q